MKPTPDCIIELSSNGYCETSNYLHNYMRNHPDIRQNIFRFSAGVAAHNKGNIKYSSLDIFGQSNLIYYVLDCKDARKEFSDYLVKLLRKNNPRLKQGVRRVFTQMLHQYGIHSELCSGLNCNIVDSISNEFGKD